jgi:hypothetical protein
MASVTIVLDHKDVESIAEYLSENISEATAKEIISLILTPQQEEE